MSDTNPVTTGSIWRRKVAGIPLIYLAGGIVAILTIFAFRTMRTPDAPDESVEVPTETDQNPDADFGTKYDQSAADYTGFVAKGSITAAPAEKADADPVVETNETWLAKAVQWNIGKGISAGLAQSALQTYLAGSDLTVEQGQIRDNTIKEFGLPPEPPFRTNATPSPSQQIVARRQGPTPRTHVVTNTADNTYAKLAALYYPTSDNTSVSLLRNANRGRLVSDGPFAVGTSVWIPKYTVPKYYTATKSIDTAKEIGAKNGISAQAVVALNPGMKFPVKAGTQVRVK